MVWHPIKTIEWIQMKPPRQKRAISNTSLEQSMLILAISLLFANSGLILASFGMQFMFDKYYSFRMYHQRERYQNHKLV